MAMSKYNETDSCEFQLSANIGKFIGHCSYLTSPDVDAMRNRGMAGRLPLTLHLRLAYMSQWLGIYGVKSLAEMWTNLPMHILYKLGE